MNRAKSKQRLAVNTAFGIINRVTIAVLGLFLRRLFIQYLGTELSGLSSLFTSIIDFLNLATAGFMAAVTPRLYEYNAADDYDHMNRIMKFTRRFYAVTTAVIFFSGLACSFFIQNLAAGNMYPLLFLRTVFMVQVSTQCIRVMIAPWQGLLNIRERGYLYTVYELFINLAVYLIQGIVVVTVSDYVCYLLVNLAGQMILYAVLNQKIKKIFPWLLYKSAAGIERKAGLISDICHTLFMQISNFLFMSTDSIVISAFFGLTVTNAYGNYMTIATAVTGMYSSLEEAVKVFFGNKVHPDSPIEEKEFFLNMSTYLFYMAGSFCGILYSCLIEDFIRVWLGTDFIQTRLISVLFGSYLFFRLLFCAVQDYLQNFGLFQPELKANMTAAVMNLILSVLLAQKYGIAGILMGTLAGFLAGFLLRIHGVFSEMKEKAAGYLFRTGCYTAAFYTIFCLCMHVTDRISAVNVYVRLVQKLLSALILTGGLNLAFCWRKAEQRTLIKIVKNIWK